MSSMRGGNGNSESLMMFFTILLIFLNFLIYGYFVFFVYKLAENIKHDCPCAAHPVRYLLYIQAVVVFINLLFLLVGLINM